MTAVYGGIFMDTGNIVPQLTNQEHATVNGTHVKKVVLIDGMGNLKDANPSTILSFNAAGDLIKIEKTIGETTYTKTISNADEVVASTKVISSWS
jgi:hypothetical protein